LEYFEGNRILLLLRGLMNAEPYRILAHVENYKKLGRNEEAIAVMKHILAQK
jgi:hypothetical protein